MTFIGGHIEVPNPEWVARETAARDQHAEAVTEWEAIRADLQPEMKLAATLLELLDLHQPKLFVATVHCSDCVGRDGEPESWPCETYATIRDNLKGQS